MSLSASDFKYVSDLVRERTAIVIEPGKEYLVEVRLAPLMKAEGLNSIDDLVNRVRANRLGPLVGKITEAMTTNETLFFRDQHPFESLRAEVLPGLIKERLSERQLKIWCAASSSGQEPYSLCMLLKESFPMLDTWSVEIIASDISPLMLERTRQGIYSMLEVNRGLPPGMLERYFEQDGSTWQVKAALRKMLTVKEINLAGCWGVLPCFDIVMIRNVLIYFDTETKREIMGKVRKLLRPGGVMMLGSSETTINIAEEFERIRTGSTWVYRAAS